MSFSGKTSKEWLQEHKFDELINLWDFSSQLETEVTTLIRNTGRKDEWPAAFKKHVREREARVLEKLKQGEAELFVLPYYPLPSFSAPLSPFPYNSFNHSLVQISDIWFA